MRNKFEHIIGVPEDRRGGNGFGRLRDKQLPSLQTSQIPFECLRWKNNELTDKARDSRAAFKVGVAFNRLLDEEQEVEDAEDHSEDSGISFFTAKDSEIDALPNNCEITQPSSFICDNDGADISSTSRQKRKKRRVVKKRNPQENCLGVEVLPDSFQAVFSFRHFNRMQTEAFPFVYGSGRNCVVSSPTGSGKTVLFELAIMRLVREMGGAANNTKVLYIAPTKSLCCEKYKSWSPKFLGLSVGMLTSDTSFLETEKVKRCNIIITTPEKWDLLTRKWKDYSRLFELVKLILVDEVHILRERRGATLEVVLTRMNLFCEDIRIIAVSATIPNVKDVAQWLGSKYHNEGAQVLAFDDTYRQVTLEKHVYGYSFNSKNEFQHDSLYNLKLDEILVKHSKQRAVMIFCPTRASTVSTAKYVAQHCPSYLGPRSTGQNYQIEDQSLASLVNQGVAFHHAGLSMTDRNIVEQGFLSGVVKVLCSTSTLAVGVNLPAYLVIIKGTRMWNSSVTQEYTQLDILQMIGRAGRPQFEKTGCAVILTESRMKQSYEKLLLGTDELESALHLELIEHLAAEVSLATIFSTKSAVTWLRNTYFYVRFKRNPSAYHNVDTIDKDSLDQDAQLVHFVQGLLDVLLRFGIIEHQNDRLICTSYGNAMARHYVLFESMKRFMSAKNNQTPDKVLDLLAYATEFADMRIRQKEKRLYKEINSSPLLRYPYLTEGKQSRIIDSPHQKVSLLIQYELGGLEYPSYNGAFALHQTMVQDKLLVFRHCFRLLKCMVDIFVEKKDGTSLKNALFLLRSVSGNCWEDSVMVLRQLKSIGLVSVRKLVQRGVRGLQDMRTLSDQQIESYLSLKMNNGSKIRRDVNSLPQLAMECTLQHFKPHNSSIVATFKVQISATFSSAVWHGHHLSINVEILKASGKLLDFRRISLAHLASPQVFTVDATIKSDDDDVEFGINCLEVPGIGDRTKFYAADLLSGLSGQFAISANQDAQQQEPMASSPSSDDSILEYLSAQPDRVDKLGARSESDTSKRRKVRSNGNFECYHTCRDKTKCRHLCCKEGIPGDCLRDKSVTDREQTTHSAFESNDAGDFKMINSVNTDSKRCKVPSTILQLDTANYEERTEKRTVAASVEGTTSSTITSQKQVTRPNSALSSSSVFNASERFQESDLEFLGSDVELN